MKRFLALLLWGAATVVQAQDWAVEGTHRFYGYAYDLVSNKYLYTELHEQVVVKGRWVKGSIRYLAPDGSSLGNKSLDFTQNSTIPVYRLDSPRDGYAEGITAVGDTIKVIRRQKTGEEMESKTLKRQGLMAADSGFHSFLVEHFKTLLDGQTVKFRFIAAGRLDDYRFRGKRIADTTFEGKPAVRFRVEMDSMLNLLAGPLEATYDARSQKLLEYRGISNIHDPGTGEPFEAVRIAYYSVPPPEAPKLPPLN